MAAADLFECLSWGSPRETIEAHLQAMIETGEWVPGSRFTRSNINLMTYAFAYPDLLYLLVETHGVRMGRRDLLAVLSADVSEDLVREVWARVDDPPLPALEPVDPAGPRPMDLGTVARAPLPPLDDGVLLPAWMSGNPAKRRADALNGPPPSNTDLLVLLCMDPKRTDMVRALAREIARQVRTPEWRILALHLEKGALTTFSTALHMATAHGNSAAVLSLLEFDADPNALDPVALEPPLSWAFSGEIPLSAEALGALCAGTRVWTPRLLCHLAALGDCEMLERFPEGVRAHGARVLCYAGSAATVETLFRLGADPSGPVGTFSNEEAIALMDDQQHYILPRRRRLHSLLAVAAHGWSANRPEVLGALLACYPWPQETLMRVLKGCFDRKWWANAEQLWGLVPEAERRAIFHLWESFPSWDAALWLCKHGVPVSPGDVESASSFATKIVLSAFCVGAPDTSHVVAGQRGVVGVCQAIEAIGRRHSPSLLRVCSLSDCTALGWKGLGVTTLIVQWPEYVAGPCCEQRDVNPDSDFCHVVHMHNGAPVPSRFGDHPVLLWNRARLNPLGLRPETFASFPEPIRELARAVLLCLRNLDPRGARWGDALIRTVLLFIGRLTYFVPTLEMQHTLLSSSARPVNSGAWITHLPSGSRGARENNARNFSSVCAPQSGTRWRGYKDGCPSERRSGPGERDGQSVVADQPAGRCTCREHTRRAVFKRLRKLLLASGSRWSHSHECVVCCPFCSSKLAELEPELKIGPERDAPSARTLDLWLVPGAPETPRCVFCVDWTARTT